MKLNGETWSDQSFDRFWNLISAPNTRKVTLQPKNYSAKSQSTSVSHRQWQNIRNNKQPDSRFSRWSAATFFASTDHRYCRNPLIYDPRSARSRFWATMTDKTVDRNVRTTTEEAETSARQLSKRSFNSVFSPYTLNTKVCVSIAIIIKPLINLQTQLY